VSREGKDREGVNRWQFKWKREKEGVYHPIDFWVQKLPEREPKMGEIF